MSDEAHDAYFMELCVCVCAFNTPLTSQSVFKRQQRVTAKTTKLISNGEV